MKDSNNQPESSVLEGNANLDTLHIFHSLQARGFVHQNESRVCSPSNAQQGQKQDGGKEEPGRGCHGYHRGARIPRP